MKLLFSGGDQQLRIDIDRPNKKAVVYSSKTDYKPVPIKFYELFPGEPRQQKVIERVVKQYDDDKFYDVVARGMQLAGYTLIKKDDKLDQSRK